jgi:hypothetical protein
MPTLTVAGVYDIPADVYHADPVPGGSLSSSEARLLLPPSCPARFAHERNNPPDTTDTFDFGHAAHNLVLGAGADLDVVDADDWRTKAAQGRRADARALGHVPILRADYERASAMAGAVRAHPIARALFDQDRGKPERALFWVDGDVWRRALVDWLPDPGPGRLIVADYKTTRSAAPESIRKAMYDYGYHQQADWYLDGVASLGLAGDAAFVFVFQEKTPPYLVTVAQPDPTALRVGRDLNRQAIDVYRECVASGRWPGYADDVVLARLPGWVENIYAREIW